MAKTLRHILTIGMPTEIAFADLGSAGFLWDLSPLTEGPIVLLQDLGCISLPGAVGGGTRRLVVLAQDPGSVEIVAQRPFGPKDQALGCTLVFIASR